ncbi:MAG: hypothetical protein LUH47_00570, partial [Clostridiales bacterium]|nr:hypothetical protein [Clostridiales bacterium]
DYYNINGIAYIPVSTLTKVANSIEYWGLYAKFNSYDKTLDFRSGVDGTSLYNFKRLFTVNRCEAYSSDPYMNDVDYKEKIIYDYPPKIIDDHFCIPARTLANPWSIEYDANTKELTIIVQTA